jgi:hypothetical protein
MKKLRLMARSSLALPFASMKPNRLHFVFLAIAVAAFSGSIYRASAQVYAKDDAAGYTNAPGGQNYGWLYNTTTNGGFGFTPWVYTRGGSGFQGFFVGNGGQGSLGSTNGNYWGMYANSGGGDNVAVAYRGFTNSMATNTVFKIKWKPLGIGFSSTQMGGFSLRNGNVNATTNDYWTGSRLDFYYIGGGSDSYVFYDGNGVNLVGLGFGSAPFQIEITLLDIDHYRLVIKDGTGANTLTNFDNLPLRGTSGSTIDSVSLYALQTDGNQNFNNLEISSTSLVPPDIENILPANGSVYIDAISTNVSFDVLSTFSTISSNGIKLSLNGINQTNLTFIGSGSVSNHVVLNSALLDNLVYNGVITAQDANGNKATNTFTFNTWRSDNPFIEAEDYNYSSGGFIPPPNSFPDTFNGYAGLLGNNGVDYLEYDTFGVTNVYRTGDLPQLETTTDVDHAGYAGFGYTDYNLGFIKRFEFENYTRVMTNVVYDVYARMAGFGNSPTMLLERLANPTGTSSNQPRASLGTFVCPNTGGPQNWTFVQLKDFFSNPVQIRFAGTNTFRTTSLADDGSYNFNYLIFVPNTNTATLRPYLASGFPFSNANNVGPDQNINFIIANRQNSVNPSTIQVLLNAGNITPSLTLNSNAAGTAVSYQPAYPNLLPAGTNTIQVSFNDGSGSITNQWQFTVATLPIIPVADALPLNQAGLPGFALQIAKAADTASPADFPPTILRAKLHLAGQIIDVNTGLPYPNLALGTNNGFFDEPNTINYEINGTNTSGNATFPNTLTNFPYVPASPTNNFISMAANMYVQLSPGLYTFAARSDDGFMLTASTNFTSTNVTLGVFDAGRADNTPTTFSFIVQAAGLYPMRLIYDQGQFGGSVELYAVTANGNILLNDRSNANAINTYRTVVQPLVIQNPAHSGNTSTFSFQTVNGQSYTVLFKTALTDATWLTNRIITGDGSVTNITDTTATNAVRFYQIRTP